MSYAHHHLASRDVVGWQSNRKCISADVGWTEDRVVEKDEDGFELITHPTHTDRGSSLFSLELFDNYHDLSCDKLSEIAANYWSLYKGGGAVENLH